MGRIKNTIDPEKEKRWRELFARFHKSGETFRKFCADEGVSPKFFPVHNARAKKLLPLFQKLLRMAWREQVCWLKWLSLGGQTICHITGKVQYMLAAECICVALRSQIFSLIRQEF